MGASGAELQHVDSLVWLVGELRQPTVALSHHFAFGGAALTS